MASWTKPSSGAPLPRRAFRIGQGREHLLLGAVVVVEGAGREARAADDVAHGGRLIAQLAEHLARGVQDGLAVLDLGLLPLADGKIGDVCHGGT